MLRKFFESKLCNYVLICIIVLGCACLMYAVGFWATVVAAAVIIIIYAFLQKYKNKWFVYEKLDCIYDAVVLKLQELGYNNISNILNVEEFTLELAKNLCYRVRFGNALSTVDVAGSVVRTIYNLDKGKNVQMYDIFECVKHMLEHSEYCEVGYYDEQIALRKYPFRIVQHYDVDTWLNDKGKDIVVAMFEESVKKSGDFRDVDLDYILCWCRRI